MTRRQNSNAIGEPAAPSLRLAVGIATIGRPQVTHRTVRFLKNQTRAPDGIVVCAPREADVTGLDGEPGVRIVLGPHGLPRQRNAILDALTDFDVVVFFDDDFLPQADYLAEIERAHLAEPGLAMTTGLVLADGILGPGLTFEAAEALLGGADGAGAPGAAQPVPDKPVSDKPSPDKHAHPEVHNGYGCNMSVDLRLARRHAIRFDENLPLYAWWEDVDFSRRLARHGRIVHVRAARGIHLGVKSGRQSGVRLGYSQVANPLYLMRKGSCEPNRVAAQIARNVLANVAKSLWPEAYVDRRGRVRGNLRAMADLVRGRLSPVRILDF